MAKRTPITMDIRVHDTISSVLTYMVANMAQNVAEAAREGAMELQEYAQSNAPWADITGEARSGLTAETYLEFDEIVIELYHKAEHGYWLELIQDGAYAIIMPTIEALGPEIIRRAGGSVIDPGGEF